MLYLPTMYVYCVYLEMPIKSKNKYKIYLKRAETFVVVIVFNGVLCDVQTYKLLPSFTVALHQVPGKLY